MKIYLVVPAALLIVFVAYLVNKTNEVELVPVPHFESVIFNDERSNCEKVAELALYDKWSELSGGVVKPLKKSDADIAFLYHDLSLEMCQDHL